MGFDGAFGEFTDGTNSDGSNLLRYGGLLNGRGTWVIQNAGYSNAAFAGVAGDSSNP